MRFSEIIGHERQKAVLKRAIASDRVPHSFLFTGVEGTGKRSLALALATVLNCQEELSSEDKDACGECASCVSILSGSHLNLFTVAPEKGYLKIDAIRELQRDLRFKVERGRRVVVIDGAEMMNASAQNALLKTLEEPPPDTVMILVTAKPSLLLPTILSRCRRMNFPPLKCEEVQAVLIKSGLAEDEAARLAPVSLGSVTRALSLSSSGLYEEREGKVTEMLSLSSGPGDIDSLLTLARKFSKDDDLFGILEHLKISLRDQMLLFSGMQGLTLNTGEGKTVLSGLSSAGVSRLFTAVDRAERNTAPPLNGNKQLTLEALMIEFADTIAPINSPGL